MNILAKAEARGNRKLAKLQGSTILWLDREIPCTVSSQMEILEFSEIDGDLPRWNLRIQIPLEEFKVDFGHDPAGGPVVPVLIRFDQTDLTWDTDKFTWDAAPIEVPFHIPETGDTIPVTAYGVTEEYTIGNINRTGGGGLLTFPLIKN